MWVCTKVCTSGKKKIQQEMMYGNDFYYFLVMFYNDKNKIKSITSKMSHYLSNDVTNLIFWFSMLEIN